ncbi:macro domain-containing protein [Plantactinospora siamensis]|uniref:Macro domain-containing protein n=1 Tax=Plantactinospora siamensis TaxID=555372 RepID=A0ABV6P7P6_9ACTN
MSIAAAVFLVLCLASFGWGSRPSAVGIRHTLFVLAWLCAALTATLVVFSAFPSTTADGTVLGVTLGGAGAFVLLLWTAAIRAGGVAAHRDANEAQAVRRAEVAAAGAARPAPAVLTHQHTHWFQLRDGAGERPWVGVVTGDLRAVRGVDAWVNAENTDMMMARVHDFSVSSIIRYEGARRDVAGRVLNDLIAEELAETVRDRRPVAAGSAIVTSSGALAESHEVRFVVHVAAVEGQPGAGYRPIRDLGVAVARTLTAAAAPGFTEPARTILFPLLGAGAGGAPVEETAAQLITAVVHHLAHGGSPRLERVLVLAYTDAELTACLRALAASPGLVRRRGGPALPAGVSAGA